MARDGEGMRLRIEASLAGELTAGDSVAVSGVCLTAVELGDSAFTADLSPETVARSTLGSLTEGDLETSNCHAAGRPAGWAHRAGPRRRRGHDGRRRWQERMTCASPLCRTAAIRGRRVPDGRRSEPHGDRRRRRRLSVSFRRPGAHHARHGRPGRPVNLEVDVIASTWRSWCSDERIPLRNHRGRARGHPRRADGRRLRRRGPRERGDLTLAAQFATPENINFMAREARA